MKRRKQIVVAKISRRPSIKSFSGLSESPEFSLSLPDIALRRRTRRDELISSRNADTYRFAPTIACEPPMSARLTITSEETILAGLRIFSAEPGFAVNFDQTTKPF